VAYNKLHQSKSIKNFERNFEIKVKTRQGSKWKMACVGMRPNLRYRLKRMCCWKYRPRCWRTREPSSTLTPTSPVQMQCRCYTTEPPYNTPACNDSTNPQIRVLDVHSQTGECLYHRQ